MKVYKNIKTVSSGKAKSEKNVVSRKKLHYFGLIFVCVITLGMFGVSLDNLGLSNEVKNITASWSPNISGLGKLKFVVNPNEDSLDVMASVSGMEMPFENSYISEVEAGLFEVNGLGGIIVKSCLAGKVSKVENVGGYKSVYVSHGKGLTSVYEKLDTIGVKENDKVEKNTPLGVSLSSVINFKVLYKNKTLAGLSVKDGEMTFI